jgi:uncharacterized protein YlbG (UPF0298 family)
MATWKRFFNTPSGPISRGNQQSNDGIGLSKYSSGLKEVYTGPANRLHRYDQFDQLDRDPVINSALNIIAEFCTQENQFTKLPFYFNFNESTSDAETSVLRSNLNHWARINGFRKRMFYIFRNILKYGDIFFIRDPETYEWLYIDPRNIEKIVVDESNGKTISSYFVRNISLNLSQKIATHDTKTAQANYTGLMPNTLVGRQTQGSLQSAQNMTQMDVVEIPAEHIVHLSLNSTGMDYINWPFSASILESVYKPAKQKELLENAFLIYTIQRAPERRVFYVYTGDAPAHKAMEFVERFKYELHQKRIPTRDGGGNSIIDGTYDPQSLSEDYFVPVNSEGQGPRIETLPGGDAMAAGVDNLKFFNNLITRGLGIPSSYIPTDGEDSPITYNDGRTGVALLQEWRFAQHCKRLQSLIRDEFDAEFKKYCFKRGTMINNGDFTIEFEEPQSFAEYRQMQKDSDQLNVLSTASGLPYIAKRFALKRFGGMTDEEIKENERLWKEENRGKIKGTVADIENIHDIEDIDLNNVGIKKPKGEEDEIE